MDASKKGLLLFRLADLIERDRVYIAVSIGFTLRLTLRTGMRQQV